MSEFLASRFANACPYRPGEQPKDRTYVKLNANETSVAPSPRVRDALRDEGLFEGLGAVHGVPPLFLVLFTTRRKSI